MNPSNIFVVFHKELIDTLRDRRTLISTIVVPIVLFPLLTIGFGMVAARLIEKARQETSAIMVLGEEHAPKLAARLRETEGLRVVPTSDDYVQQINDKKLRAAVAPDSFLATKTLV